MAKQPRFDMEIRDVTEIVEHESAYTEALARNNFDGIPDEGPEGTVIFTGRWTLRTCRKHRDEFCAALRQYWVSHDVIASDGEQSLRVSGITDNDSVQRFWEITITPVSWPEEAAK